MARFGIDIESLMSALARVLREDGRMSMELATNIVRLFSLLSNFNEFHNIIMANRLGDLCFMIIDHELKKSALMSSDFQIINVKGNFTCFTPGIDSFCLIFADESPENEVIFSVPDQANSKLQTFTEKQDQLLYFSLSLLLNLADDLNLGLKMARRGIVHFLLVILERSTPELLCLALKFLVKLSIFEENKSAMILVFKT
jgi:Kinesin-associated protein (KAP)